MESKYKRGSCIWVDALLYRSEEHGEAQHSGQAHEIYEETRAVYAWVGPDLQEGEWIYNFINYMAAAGLESLETG